MIASEDWNAGADAAVTIVDAVTPITVSNVAVPTIASVSYDAATGVLTATGSGFLSASGSNNDINALKLTFVGEGGAYTLTGNSADIVDATTFAIGLNATDKDRVNLIINKNGTTSTSNTTYNLVASEDWNAGADAAVTIVDATSPITAVNVALPTITSALYDANSGVLTVTGTGFLKLAGAGNDINLTNLLLVGEGNQSRVLTASMGGGVDVTSTTSFVVQLSAADMSVANTFMNKTGTTATGGAAFNLAALEDWNVGADASLTIADVTSAVTVSNPLTPSIASATLAFTGTTGSLILTGTGFLKLVNAANEIIATKFTFTGEGGNTYTLTSATADVDINNATSATITIGAADAIALKEILNSNGFSSTGGTSYNIAAAEDWNAGADAGVNIADATTTLFVSNVPVPTITSATYNVTTGVLAVTGVGILSLTGSGNDIDVTKLSIESEGTGYLLTGATANVDIFSSTSFSITLGAMDKAGVDALVNKNGTTSTSGTTYNLRALDNWNAGAGAPAAIQDLAGNGITVSNVAVPTITSALYDGTSGVLTVTGTSLFKLAGAGNEIDLAKLTITGEDNLTYTIAHTTNVDILSGSLFAVTLSAADRTALNVIINKAGLTSTGGATYNLAAAEDWAAGADAAVTIADLTGNPISVSNVPTPVITSAAYDVVTGVLTVTGTGFVKLTGAANDIDAAKFTFTGEGSGTYPLTSNTANADVLSATEFTLTLGATDKAAVDLLLNNNGTASTGGTTYNLAAAEDWITGADATVNVADLTGNVITVTSVPVPTITSALYDAGTGILTVTGTGLLAKSGAANDIDATKITFAGEGGAMFTLTGATPDAEIISATSFVMVLGTADRAKVNEFINKNGTASTGATAYNLIANEDWDRGADASVTIADPTNTVTASGVAIPTVTSATYDATSGVLTVTGTGFLKSSGASNDINLTKFNFAGEAGYTLTTAGAEIIDGTSFAVTVNAADKIGLAKILNKAGTSSTGLVTYNFSATEDWNSGADAALTIADNVGNPITVSNVPVPTITAAAYDIVSGVLTVTGTGFLKIFNPANDIIATKFTITGEGGATYLLTSNTANVDILSGTSFALTLGATDKAGVELLLNNNGTASTGGTTYNLAAAEDWNAGADAGVTIADLTGNGITVSSVPVPTITSSVYDAATGVLTVTGTALLSKSGAGNDIDATKFKFVGEGGLTYTLTSNTIDAELLSPTSFALGLGATDRAAVNMIINKNGTASTNATTYNLEAAEDWNRGADASVTTVDATGNGITVSNVAVPTITSAAYNASTGVLSVTGTGFVRNAGAANDITIGKLTLTGEASLALTTGNVEITDGTSFSVTLNPADKAAVNAFMNKNGSSGTSGVTYNLAAAEDWAAGADASLTVADLTGNAVTVSAVAVPTITSAVYDPVTGVLAVTGTDLLKLTGANNDIDVTKLTLTGEAGGTRQLTSGSVDLNSATSFFVTLNTADKAAVNALLNKDGTASTDATTYNLAAAEDWASGADAAVTVADITNGVTVSGMPTITIVGTLGAVNTVYGTASATPATFTVSGANMVAGILITPPAGYEVSQTAGGTTGYAGQGIPITVGGAGSIASTTVYVRLSDSTAFGTYTGNVVATSTSAVNKSIATTSSNVAKKAVTVTANNGSKTYGTVLSGVSGSTAFVPSGLVHAQTIGSVTISYTAGGGNGNTATDPVAVYAGKITPSAATGGTFNTNNYSISYIAGDLTVNAAALTVTATNVAKTYGATLTGGAGSTAFTSTGLVNAETIGSITIVYEGGGGNGNTTTDPVGLYTNKVIPSAATGGTFTSTNYNIVYVRGNITINPAALSITAGNVTKNFHTLANLTGTAFTPTGLLNGETVGSVAFTSVGAAVAATVGNYPITPSGAAGGTFTAGNYVISYVNGNLQVIPSVNADLSSVVVSNGTLTPVFAASTTSYNVSVGNLVTSITLTPTVDVPGTTVTVNGNPVVSGTSSLPVSLAIGTNPITVVSTAGDGVTTKTYVFNVTRAVSSDAGLSALSLISGTISPTFSTGVLNYTATVSNATLTAIAVATAANVSATIVVNGLTVTSGSPSGALSLNVGSGNVFNIAVTAADGVTSQLYKVTVTRLPNVNSLLASLTVSSGTLSSSFSPGQLNYTVAVPFGTTSMTVTPTTAEVSSTVKVNGITVTSGTASDSISLAIGSNTINVVVTAQDGVTKSTYQVVVTRAAGNNAELSSLRLSTGVLAPTFTPATLNYTSTVPNGTSSITVTPTLADVTGVVTVNGITVTSGSPSGLISLTVGANTLNIRTTAVDGITSKAYQVVVTRASGASTNTNLVSITMSTGTLSPVFTSTTTNYAALIGETINTLALTVTAAEVSATLKVNGLTATSGVPVQGIDVTNDITLITISVTAADGVTTNAYTITITKPRTSWTGNVGNAWNNTANWTNGVPGSTKSAVVTNANTLPVITGNESVNNLTINANAGLTITGGLQVLGNAVNSGTISGTGALTFGGTLAQTLSGTGSISNLTVNNPTQLSIAPGAGNTQSLTGLLKITAGNLNTGNNLVLVSTASGTASVGAIPAGSAIVGQVTAQRWLTGQRGFRGLGHPFNAPMGLNQLTDNFAITGNGGGFVSGLGYSGPSVLYYDSVAASPAFYQKPLTMAPNTAATPLWSVARGIMALVRGKGTEGLSSYTTADEPTAFAADVTGTLNQGTLNDYVLGVNATNSSFNLVGNPYAAPINIRSLKSNGGGLLSANNSATGVVNTIYVFNPSKNAGISNTPNQEMRGGMDAYTNDGSTDIIIPPFGAFFVQAKAAGNVIRFDEASKAVDKTAISIMGSGKTSKLTLQVENKRGTWDDIKLRWDNKAGSAGTDVYDGLKLNNELFDFYSISSDKRNLCIDSRSDSFSREEIIPLGINTQVVDASFRIKVVAYDMPSNVRLFLRDKLLNTETPLEKVNDGYSFAITAEEASKGNNRFELAVNFAKQVTAPVTDVQDNIRFMPNPFKDELIIQLGRSAVSATSTTKVRLVNMLGRVVKTATGAPGIATIRIQAPDLAAGSYFVEVINDAGRTTKQVIKE
ncbi:cadherin-like beta sandwich domain-containing protein [Sediminibacterium roseum]|nr:cadherin-like beta sandwich domain-containing protein [Sediminibacterium roseum]